MIEFKRGLNVITPDGYCAIVELCGHPDHVLVWLSNANQLPREKRLKHYDKDAEGWQVLSDMSRDA